MTAFFSEGKGLLADFRRAEREEKMYTREYKS